MLSRLGGRFMKISVRMVIVFILLLAAIGYTIYNWITGTIDGTTAGMYVLVLCFPMIRALSAFTKRLQESQK